MSHLYNGLYWLFAKHILIFQCLDLSQDARKDRTVGELNNLITSDCGRVHGLVSSIHEVWTNVLRTTLGLVFLWHFFGLATLSALVVIVFVACFNAFVLSPIGTKVHVSSNACDYNSSTGSKGWGSV